MTGADASQLPLTGITIIAVEQYGAGPYGTMLLADLGARVIKIENPADGGDVGRAVGPFFFGEGDSHFFQSFNRNKESLTLNLKKPAARDVLLDLVRHADGVLDNLRGDQAEKLGLTYDALREANPAIVCAHLSAYGRTGSRQSWPGYDYLMQAEAGYLSVTGEPDGAPSRFGLSIVDMMTGLTCAFGLLAALPAARATGQGRDVDVSLFDVAVHNLSYLGTWYLNGGHVQGREPRSSHPSLTPSQLYKTQDGWIFIMCNKEKFWPILAEKLEHPEWAEDPELATFDKRLANRAQLSALLDAELSKRPTEEWLDLLSGVVPVAPVNDIGQALENPFVAEQGRVATFEYPEGRFRAQTGPFRLSDASLPTDAAPALGAQTERILEEIGYNRGRVEALRDEGVI
jgi:crotonobetainyl-CoA:carnitine CoA-transferase CaiB-like acyl-CoA transferase